MFAEEVAGPEGYQKDPGMHSVDTLLRLQERRAALYPAAGLAVCCLCRLAGPLAQAAPLLFCRQCRSA